MNYKAQRIVKDKNGIAIGFEAIETPESVAKRTAELVAHDTRKILKEKDEEIKRKAMTKYYKRGQREFFQVTPERVIRIVNKLNRSEVSIIFNSDSVLLKWSKDSAAGDALEGTEITREEFAKEFAIASKLIALDPV